MGEIVPLDRQRFHMTVYQERGQTVLYVWDGRYALANLSRRMNSKLTSLLVTRDKYEKHVGFTIRRINWLGERFKVHHSNTLIALVQAAFDQETCVPKTWLFNASLGRFKYITQWLMRHATTEHLALPQEIVRAICPDE